MPTLSKARDAAGRPINPAALYTPITSHARGTRVYNRDAAELRGDHEAVQAAPQLWIAVNADSETKERARKAHQAAAVSHLPPQPEDVHRPRIAEPRSIPLERLVFAPDAFWKGSVFVARGSRHDIGDPIVQAAPEMFLRPDGSPLPREAA